MKFAFVILHYNTVKDTIECIESILTNLANHEFNIVVVENGSSNNSGVEIEKKYEDNNLIDVVISKKNLGFAKGNNLGFNFAKLNHNPDFIVMLNNDTIIKQKDFFEHIIRSYTKDQFVVAGPRIISLIDSMDQNPIPYLFKDKNSVKKRIIKFNILRVLSFVNLDTKLTKITNKRFKKKSNRHFEDFQLHGSCLIFSKEYINRYDGLYEKTFMYMEEDILKFISVRDKLKMAYIKDAEVYHKEDSATDSIFNKATHKRRFYYTHSIDSSKKLLELMGE